MPPPYNPWADPVFPSNAAFGTGSPAEDAQRQPNMLDNLLSHIAGALGRGFMAPGNALNSPTPLTSEQMIAPAHDMTGLLVTGGMPMAEQGAAGMVGGRLFKKLTGPAESDPNYVYHATNTERAADIAESGLIRHKPNEFTDQSVWPDGAVDRRNYFTPTAQNTWQFAPEDGTPTLLRIRKDSHPFQSERGTGDLYSTKVVPAHKIEYQHENGDWLPLIDKNAPKPK